MSAITKNIKSKESKKLIPDAKEEYVWQYHNGTWKNYDAKASDVVEKAYQDYLKNRETTAVCLVKSGEWEYMIDFLAKQTNIRHENHTTRDIRRLKNLLM